MNTTQKILLAVAVAGVVIAAPTGVAAQERGDVARGAEAYGATCGRCHTARSPVERSDRDWIVIVNHMRARGAGITGQQVRDLLAFLQASNQVGGDVVQSGSLVAPTESVAVSEDPADVASGLGLISSKGCIGCHRVGGAGGAIGPDLDGVVAAKGADFVAQKIGNPSFNNPGTLMPNFGLSQDEIHSLIAYLATIRAPRPDRPDR
jgi:mono/diheme cytochrome c family protein